MKTKQSLPSYELNLYKNYMKQKMNIDINKATRHLSLSQSLHHLLVQYYGLYSNI